jgi:hypothetical protein
MKLYTEEQVKIAYSKGNNDGYCGIQRDFIGLNLMPIELPSNEEIKDKSFNTFSQTNARTCFEEGAKWIKNKCLIKTYNQ